MKVAYKKFENQTLAVATTNFEAIDMSQYSAVGCQVVTPAASAGTVQLQWSNDGINWINLSSVALAASTSVGVQTTTIYGALIRVQMIVSAGAGVYSILLTLKES